MKTIKKGTFIALLFLLVSVFALGVSITDVTGTSLNISTPPKRIVACVPSDSEMLFDLGLGDKVVGVNDWANYPEAVTQIEKIGGSPLNIEKIISLKPDVVLANAGLVPQEIEKMRELGLVVLAINPTDLDSTLETYLLVGKAFGVEVEAQQLVSELTHRQTKILPLEKKPRVFVEIWNDPLMTSGKGSLWDSLIEKAGGENIGALAQGAYPVFSIEELIKQDPDLIILTNFNLEEAKNRPGYTILKDRLIEVDPSLYTYPTKRLWAGLENLYEIFQKIQ
ncbi:MAG TPA: ABC transporter substrate-binding protein [Firmicutes bacterium]|nr:ABC transporter substrate-binding protein [Bacillota bacterium]